VRDVVDLHLRAVRHPTAAGERFIAVSGAAVSLYDIAQILRTHFPASADLLPATELTIEQVREAAKTIVATAESQFRLGLPRPEHDGARS
jgi:dihydroflavonol-4-reductase